MDQVIIKVSLLRVKTYEDFLLSRNEKKIAFEKYGLKTHKFSCPAQYDNNAYYIYNNYELLWYCRESRQSFINVAIPSPQVPEITATLKTALLHQKLDPIKEASLYQEYMQLEHITQHQLAAILHKTQGAISNKLRLLQLPQPIQKAIAKGTLKERHGRAILKLEREHEFYEKAMVVYAKILDNNLSVAETDDMVDVLLGKPIPYRDSVIIKKINNKKDFKVPEASMIVNEVETNLNKAINNIQELFPRLEILVEQGVDKKDYIFLIKLKGLNDGKNNSHN